MPDFTEMDYALLRRAIDVARQARAHGNHPFGAVLAGEMGQVLLDVENTVLTMPDVTGHAETNLIRLASGRWPRETLAQCTLYTSTEPCPMCAGAIYWAGVVRVVYGLSQESFYALGGEGSDGLLLHCRDVFGHGRHVVEVLGPALEAEAQEVHAGFWTRA